MDMMQISMNDKNIAPFFKHITVKLEIDKPMSKNKINKFLADKVGQGKTAMNNPTSGLKYNQSLLY